VQGFKWTASKIAATFADSQWSANKLSGVGLKMVNGVLRFRFRRFTPIEDENEIAVNVNQIGCVIDP
jgi:hypothetical protein